MMTSMATTPTAELADLKLGDNGPLEVFVRAKRSQGHSWRSVASELNKATGGSVQVSYETLRIWFPDGAA